MMIGADGLGSDFVYFVYGVIFAALVSGYLIGSIPFGLLLTRLAGLGDIRQTGSGNIGATNVLRTGNKRLAAVTLLADILKGALAVSIWYLLPDLFTTNLSAISGFGAFIGHLFPVWLKFKGGKGVATYIGVVLALSWLAGLVFIAVWLLVAFISRYSSLAALVASLTPPLVFAVSGQPEVVAVTVIMTILLYIRHRQNISRLLDGSEDKIGA
jgi:glycerol-3-phosphate acyltransferase PlsY